MPPGDYLNFVANQGRTYEELETCFVALAVKKQLNDLAQSKKSKLHVEALKFIRTAMGNRGNPSQIGDRHGIQSKGTRI